ncbi:hypothetical protein EVAR_38944_1 [Eumeta japonica]|uniref:Uncharacterized protein n=1 Tax=Eumeta variegata TaxID=151549 RepID=A0A4C1W8I8_EUMVA|nr:hypothetical protein EVAR_38944_1 [Eumeta japonica]
MCYCIAAVHADTSLIHVGERQMSNAAERGGRLCLFVARCALSLALQALNGTPQSEVTPHESCFSHIHQGPRSVKTTDTTSLGRPLSCNGERATRTIFSSLFDHCMQRPANELC